MELSLKQKRKINSFLLLELVIGIALLGILITFLVSNLRKIGELRMQADKAHASIHPRALVQLKLSQLFDQLSIKSDPQNLQIMMLSESRYPALIFSLEEQLDPDPAFSGTVYYQIYLNHKKELILASSCGEAKREEILLASTESLKWELLNAKTRKWETSSSTQSFPMALRLQTDAHLQFSFLIPEQSSSFTQKEDS